MQSALLEHLNRETARLVDLGLFKEERVISSAQSAEIMVDGPEGAREVINLCANNYLGLSNHPALVQAAKDALDSHGYGLSSVRFICGTQNIHKALEEHISTFLGTEDTILYASCFDANAGLFETLLGEEDAIISDALNHASIIDGVRLCKARRYRYANNDMAALEDCLKQSKDARFRLIATDGVFSMDGIIANLPAICDLAERYDAMVMVDDSHAVGFTGPNGGGSPDYWGVRERIHMVTGTLGKALGGASGGYTAARNEIVTWLRQRSRPYLFSNSLAPMITASSIEAIKLLSSEEGIALRQVLQENGRFFRSEMAALGFDLVPGEHPIIPVMLGDAKLAQEMAARLFRKGVYVTGFSYPVVPMGHARIRTQMSAGLTSDQLTRAVAAFAEVGREMKVI